MSIVFVQCGAFSQTIWSRNRNRMNSVLAHDCPPIGLPITFRALPSHRDVPPSRRRSYAELSGGGSSDVSGARLSGAVGGSWAIADVMSFGIAAAAILTCTTCLIKASAFDFSSTVVCFARLVSICL
jgi:hypothetical protein